MVNDVIWRAVKRAKIPAHKDPTGLVLQNSKRPDVATLIPWSRGKALSWDVTVPDTYATSHIQSTSVEVCSTAKHAASSKISKYHELSATHIFYSVSIETAGSWDAQAVEHVEEIGRRSAMETDDPNEKMYLFQRISVAIQKGNILSFTNTFDIDNNKSATTVITISSLYNNTFLACRLCADRH